MPDPEVLIDRVRRSYEAFNRGDFETALRWAHPDIVFTRLGGQGEIRGLAEMHSWMEPDAFESLSFEARDLETSGNRVLARIQSTARGRGSGIEMQNDAWAVWTFDDEARIVRIEAFLAHEEPAARRALSGD
jgi:ketosteroid isomerase-like protein